MYLDKSKAMVRMVSLTLRGRCHLADYAFLAGLLLGAIGLTTATMAQAFDFGDVGKQAQTLSTKTKKKPSDNLPKEIKALTYDQYTDITYRPEKNVWRAEKLPFELSFAHE